MAFKVRLGGSAARQDRSPLDSLRIVVAVVLVFGTTAHSASAAQPQENPQTIVISTGQLALRALIWRPSGRGPFPAVLFNHGSYSTDDPISMEDSRALGSLFAKHGYFLVFLFREGVGLSGGQGVADSDRMARALIADGQEGRNRVQLRLLEHDALDEALAALAWLRACPDVDKHRIAVGGHSFGGSLSLLIAAQAPDLRGAIIFAGAAASWDQSPPLRALLLEAVGNISAPVFLVHAANDYSTAPGEALAAEMERRGRPHRLKIYPAVGHTARDGHNLVYLSRDSWQRDVFDFLEAEMRN